MSYCKACGAPMAWVKTLQGKAVPLDPEPIRGLLIESKAGRIAAEEAGWEPVQGYDERGEVCWVAPDAPPSTPGIWKSVRVTHFASCPEGPSFRKP